jgi:4-alpha-glucanotransferase
MKFPRRSGVVLHPTSLPGPYGIGDLGDTAFRFVDWLAQAGQTYWQVLPLSPTGYGDSPYQGLSAFAGNPMLISPELLVQGGHLDQADLKEIPPFPRERIDFGWLIPWKTAILHHAYENFKSRDLPQERAELEDFKHSNASWLEDVALFLALKTVHKGRAWYDWEPEIRFRKPAALTAVRRALADTIDLQNYLQWQFYRQWLTLKAYANGLGIEVIGDIPIYVARDCCDVWAHPEIFELDTNLDPVKVSGVPPDYFSEDGQFWGHPLYRWDVMTAGDYAWWIDRIRNSFMLADVVRIDHFRAFHNYWEVPATAQTAREGRWRKGPGGKLFETIKHALGDVRIIAEDLGDFDEASRAGLDALLKRYGYPGMKIVQFAFGGTAEAAFLPHNYTREWVVYTGTHDNDTAVGWWTSASPDERAFTVKYLHTEAQDIAWDLIRAAWMSVANTSMTTAQDILRLGNEARMNLPGISGPPNWCWRMRSGALDDENAAELLDLTRLYGRAASTRSAKEFSDQPTRL